MSELEVGDLVLIKELRLTGTIIEKLNNDLYKVERKNLTVVLPGNSLEFISRTGKRKEVKSRKSGSVLDDYYAIDLHGYTKFDALNEVRFIIENAELHKYTKIHITHGKGKGILRMAIHELLGEYKKNNVIYGYEFAQDNRGGYGVTIVYLQNIPEG